MESGDEAAEEGGTRVVVLSLGCRLAQRRALQLLLLTSALR